MIKRLGQRILLAEQLSFEFTSAVATRPLDASIINERRRAAGELAAELARCLGALKASEDIKSFRMSLIADDECAGLELDPHSRR